MLSLIEILILALTIFFESSGENYQGKVAVASVIRNRVDSNRFPNNYISVVIQPKQFSCYNNFYTNIKRFELKPFRDCLTIAEMIYNRNIKDNTEGALFYTRTHIKRKWMKDLKITKVYSKHKFMKVTKNDSKTRK